LLLLAEDVNEAALPHFCNIPRFYPRRALSYWLSRSAASSAFATKSSIDVLG
jgi:hypothetical protein